MHTGYFTDKPAEPQTNAGLTETVMRKLIGKDDGAKIFSMRLITIDTGGQIGLHNHPWEHEIFVVRGDGQVFNPTGSKDLSPGVFVWIPSGENHGFTNTGNIPLEFICCIPIKE